MKQTLLTFFAAAALFVGSPEPVAARPPAEQPEPAQPAGARNAPEARVTGAKVLAVGVFSPQ